MPVNGLRLNVSDRGREGKSTETATEQTETNEARYELSFVRTEDRTRSP